MDDRHYNILQLVSKYTTAFSVSFHSSCMMVTARVSCGKDMLRDLYNNQYFVSLYAKDSESLNLMFEL